MWYTVAGKKVDVTVLCGLENHSALRPEKSCAIGLITNSSAVARDGRASYRVLGEEYAIRALFTAEHGLFATGDAGEGIADTVYTASDGDVPVYSLYGACTAPTPDMLKGIDALVFDMQDVGARFYTYLYTMTRSMKSARDAGIPFWVFDRPNPVSCRTEGEVLDEKYSSFVGEYAVPTRYGLTVAEFARYVNVTKNIGADLHIVPCLGYSGGMYFGETGLPFVAPSPNIPNPVSALVYTATCIFESVANVSEGRGTPEPFSLIGAPFIDADRIAKTMNSFSLGGVRFSAKPFVPSSSKFKGRRCEGIHIEVTDVRAFSPFECCVKLFCLLRSMYELEISESANIRLFGTPRLLGCTEPDFLVADCAAKAERFFEESMFARLYPVK